MSFEAEFLTLMTQTIQVSPFISFDTYGEPIYSTSVATYACRIERNPTVVRDQLGADVVSNITAYIASTSELDPLSQYVLPDGSTGIVQSVAVQWDEDGIHHNVVNLSG